MLDTEKLKAEIKFLRENLAVRSAMASVIAGSSFDQSSLMLGLPRQQQDVGDAYFKNPKLNLLLSWCQAVCAYYSVKVSCLFSSKKI